MSSVYMTETEQLEILKKWWKKYNQIIVITISVALLVISGLRYWHWHRQKISEQASNAYEHLMIAFSNEDNKSVRSYAHELTTHYAGTVYADTARLLQAKLDINAGHYEKARLNLNEVALHSKFKVLADVAHLRLARVLVYEKSYKAALQELNQMTESNYNVLRAELRGDIYFAMGKLSQAQTEYQLAKTDIDKSGILHPFLDMKQQALIAALSSSPSVLSTHALS